MSTYNLEYNWDDVVLRYVIVAQLADLRDKIYFYNRISQTEKVKINIPFYYSVTGNDRLLLDEFLFRAEDEGKAVGDYDVVPRGIIQLDSASIDSSELTNKFVRTEFAREYGGEMKTFAMETQLVPMTMTFNTTIITNSNIEMFKALESCISKLYKTNTFYVDFGGFQVQSIYSLPEEFTQDQLFEFALDDKQNYNLTFQLETKSYIPVFENGILLSEIDQIIRDSAVNPNMYGVGMYRDGGIYFGNVMETFETKVDNIDKAPVDRLFSNEGYNNNANLGGLRPTGPIYSEDEVKE